jgi:hypothetical protein
VDDWIKAHVYLPDSKPFNIEFQIWTARWWRWLHSFPKNSSPAMDSTGDSCSISQKYLAVWFLAGTFGGVATREFRMPPGKAILFPIITSAFSFVVDPHLKSEDELVRSTVKDIDRVKKLTLRVDDFQFQDFADFRVRSQPFDDIIYGQPTRAVSDGYWIFLRPLSPGRHRIHFIGENVDFSNEVTYSIMINELIE